MIKKPKVYHTSKDQAWGTPQALFDLMHKTYQFTLDVCADPLSAKCPDWLGEDINSLTCDWWGRVFMNPPYNQTSKFMKKMAQEYQTGHITLGVALVAARPDTQWFWDAVSHATEILFLKGRLKFEQYGINATGDGKPPVFAVTTNSAPFPSCLIGFDVLEAPPVPRIGWWDWKHDQMLETAVPNIGMPKLLLHQMDVLKGLSALLSSAPLAHTVGSVIPVPLHQFTGDGR